MTSPELENLVKIGQLKRETPAAGEVAGLRRSGEARLSDAANPDLSLESRFDLAYNAAHALALALRRLGYRSPNRYLVFQTLSHTRGLPPATWRVLAGPRKPQPRGIRGLLSVDERLVDDMIAAATTVLTALRAVGSRAKRGADPQ